MLEHKKIQNLSDYFVELNSRREKGVYFYRINGYSEEVGESIKKYYDTARRTGVVIEGKIPNPDEGNLAYYNEIMGMDFQMSMDFIPVSLRKWLPRMMSFRDRMRQPPFMTLWIPCEKPGKPRICSGTHISSSCAGCIINLNAL